MSNPPTPRSFEFANKFVKVERHEKYEDKFWVRIPHLGTEFSYHEEPVAELLAQGLVVKLAQVLDEYTEAWKEVSVGGRK